MKNLKGSGVALITPFHADQSIDFSSLERTIFHVTQGGIDYLVVLGTTGESATLTREEKQEVFAFCKKTNNGRLPLVFGIGGNSTQQVIDEINRTDLTGVDAILSVSPYYNKPSQTGILQHYQAVADASPIPIILYNVPGRTMSNLSAETTLELSRHPNIIGIKEASGNLEQCMKIAAHKDPDFLLISGDDLMTTALRSIGAEGLISVLGNAYPEIIATIAAGSMETSKNATFSLLDINPLMYEESNPVGVKALMHRLGICSDVVRLPLVSASAGLSERIAKAASQLNAMMMEITSKIP
ncbi:MAG: 4-hydroxy-tetrahydrodipicolinate synthase [Lunatimonas sp.]|uniref:4-hydroxy-tetrahydrodipicolinate synthase n=1 Tax=Lunatimonas sp. TaxID=2060141 RepID=UPI00263B82BD|nr:4-hydroxy-tetrahydrodipicolinate synthase [Lunatimonas sp.]MCC5935800.1 4-hydroxy-tetrahydrodipicolinate synthase [Lunatimonas sp.]